MIRTHTYLFVVVEASLVHETGDGDGGDALARAEGALEAVPIVGWVAAVAAPQVNHTFLDIILSVFIKYDKGN